MQTITLWAVNLAPYGIGEIIECWEWDGQLENLARIAGEIDHYRRRGLVRVDGVDWELLEESVEVHPEEYASALDD